MKLRYVFIAAMVAFLIVGCGQSNKVARQAYERGSDVQEQVRSAMFVKAWGLNRALITESRQKWLNDAKIKVLQAGNNGTIPPEKACEIIARFEQELGQDEVVSSENFAYLAYLLIQGERADAMMGNVDAYIESQTPVWKQHSDSLKGGTRDFATDVSEWKPLIRDIEKALPASMIERLKGMMGTNPTSQPR